MKIIISKESMAPGIVRYELPSEVAKKTIKYLSSLKDTAWSESAIGMGVVSRHVRSSKGIDFDVLNPILSKELRSYLLACLKDYSDIYSISLVSDEGLNVLKYEDYDKYEYHTDDGPDTSRTVSILIYLNPQEYEGGQTDFKFFGISIDPPSPSIVIFPSNYPYNHAAMPVTKGTKYIVVSWLTEKRENLLSGHPEGCACSRE